MQNVEDLPGDSHKATFTLGLADETEQVKMIIVPFDGLLVIDVLLGGSY